MQNECKRDAKEMQKLRNATETQTKLKRNAKAKKCKRNAKEMQKLRNAKDVQKKCKS